MELIAALAGVVSVLTSWVVSARLLMLARRTRRTPELLLGATLLLLGGGWAPLVAIGRNATALSDAVRAALVVAGSLAAVLGTTTQAAFTWRVFRPGERGACAAVVAVGLALVGCFAWRSATIGWSADEAEQGAWVAVQWIGSGVYLWGCVEAALQHRMAVRRLAFGLSDPVVVDRLRLWLIALVAAACSASLFAALETAGIPVAGTPTALGVGGLTALLSSACLWLAFLPPRWYVARVGGLGPAEA